MLQAKLKMEDGQQMQTLTSGDNGHSDYPEGYTSLRERNRGSKGRRCCCVIASLLLILVFLSAVVILVVLMLMVGQRAPRVQTNCGMVQGEYDTKTDTFIFKGIPYAVPPTSSNRWKPPVALDNTTCWRDLMLVDRFPEPCVQLAADHPSGFIGSENCLYLNIYSPDIDPLEPAPVMVYIHGGFLQAGSINIPGYVPDERTARELGVVFVNIQYRLNAFGWFVSHVLPKSENHTGNYGLLDQIQALRWVQENIRSFGGDPDQVTVFGHSSGGTSVAMLLSTELAVGLFHRVWAMSASNNLDKSYDEAADYNQKFVNKTECLNKSCLLNLSTADVLHMVYPEWNLPFENSMDLPTKGVFEPALPVVDGEIIKKPILEQWDERMPGLPDVPVLIGVTAQEVDLAPAPGRDIEKWTSKKLYEYIHLHLTPFDESFVNQSLALYPPPLDNSVVKKYTSEYVFTTMVSDLRVICGSEILTRQLAAAVSSPVYRYVVTSWPSSPADPLHMGFRAKFAFHSWEVFAFFDAFREALSSGTSDDDQRFRDVLRDNVMNFGRVADSRWTPVAHTANDSIPVVTALISSSITVNQSYHKPQCDFWNDNGFFAYTWIN